MNNKENPNLINVVPKENLEDWVNISGIGTKISKHRIIPLLKESILYKRLTGYFTTRALLEHSEGFYHLFHNKGKMKLILGAHDIPIEIRKATELLDEVKAKEVLERIGEKIIKELELFQNIFQKYQIEALAWMLHYKKIEIKVAIPKETFIQRSNGIFHSKLMIFEDGDNIISASGSGNETLPASSRNGENWTFHCSWIEERINYTRIHQNDFEKHWSGEHEDYFIFSLPEAINEKLWEYYREDFRPPISSSGAEIKPFNPRTLGDIARILKSLEGHNIFWHLFLGPIALYPHQIYVAEEALRLYPVRRLLGDEVGLGKTLEAATILKRLFELGLVSRALILCPGGLKEQWKQEMQHHFDMMFSVVVSRDIIERDTNSSIKISNPFESEQDNMLICSWHLAKRKDVKSKLLNTQKPFDLIIIDEAHSARLQETRKGTLKKNPLFRLLEELAIRTPNLLLMTATPFQLEPAEIFGLLSILGLGGKYWGEFQHFKNYYYNISKYSTLSIRQLQDCFRGSLISADRYVNPSSIQHYLSQKFNEDETNSILQALYETKDIMSIIKKFRAYENSKKNLSEYLSILGPIHWLIIRNTRVNLENSFGELYRFSENKYIDIPVSSSDGNDIKSLRKNISNYIKKIVPEIYKEIDSNTAGFIQSTLQQRFCSSFYAFHQSINRRRMKLEKVIQLSAEEISDDSLLREHCFDIDDEDQFEMEDEVDLSPVYKMLIEKIIEEFNKYNDSETVYTIKDEINRIIKIKQEIQLYIEQQNLDPKIATACSTIVKYLNQNKKILVFSRYTDTIDIILKNLIKENKIDHNTTTLFTGKGSKAFGRDFTDLITITKHDISMGLETGKYNLVLCTDAASEGFNLQAASVIINVDVPWNPSKLEQRIGRADRLGHNPEETIEVNYLWYSEQWSVERIMYSRLLKRSHLRQIYLGGGRSIVSSAIRSAFFTKENQSDILTSAIDHLETIQKETSNLLKVMGGHQSQETGDFVTGYDSLNRVIKQFILESLKDLNISFEIDGENISVVQPSHHNLVDNMWLEGSFKVGRAKFMSLGHPLVDKLLQLEDHKYQLEIEKDDSYIEMRKDDFSNKLVKVEKSKIQELAPESIVTLLMKYMGLEIDE